MPSLEAWDAPESLTLGRLARLRAEKFPDVTAVAGDGIRLTYAAIWRDAQALASSLHGLGLRRGGVLSFQLPNWPETAVLNVAASLLGLVCNPIVPIYRDAELAAILHDGGSSCFVTPGVWRGYDYAAAAARMRAKVPGLRHLVTMRENVARHLAFEDLMADGRGKSDVSVGVSADDRKLLLFTSGTTGRAKGVLHSHRSLTAPLMRAAPHWRLGEGDGMLMPSPVTHVTGYCCGLELPFTLGTHTVLMERWDADAAVDLIDAQGLAATVGATPFLEELVAAAERHGTKLKSLKTFACGGAAVPPALVRRANTQLAGRTFRVYGASEAPLITFGTAASDTIDTAADTDGRINGYDVRIVDGDGRAVASPAEGEILIKGVGLFLGYSDPNFNATAFTREGYFRTGDLGRLLNRDGLVISGRKKDLIIRGGENISAKEIEDAVLSDIRIREAAAVAMPHPRLGETVCLFVVAAPGAAPTLADISRYLADSGLAKQKFPERLLLVESLPKTPSGKIRKDVLRASILS